MIMKEAGQMQRLTPRERGIAQLVCAGLTNKQFAGQLAVTEGTIKVHLHNVYDKLAIRNRTMLALLCASLASAETAGMGNVAALPDQPPGHLQKQSPG
jgi:DNA-binding NarL/FixJ family response regulator